MNLMLHNRCFAPNRPPFAKGLSLTELLVAMAISLVFMGSVTTAYINIARSADASQNRIQAHATARNALDSIVRDVLRIDRDPALLANQYFILTNRTFPYGDGIDNDGDGLVDEEVFDGFDDDGDWVLASDRHAVIGPYTERRDYLGIPDFGDLNVDEDCLFGNDVLSFRIPGDLFTLRPAEVITFELGSFDGEDNVLLRSRTVDPDGVAPVTTVEPLAFEVVSFDVLAMNANDDVVSPGPIQRPYWQSEYDAANYSLFIQQPIGAPGLLAPYEFPSALLIKIGVNASDFPLNEVPGWPAGSGTLQVYELYTVIALDPVINDPTYDVIIRPFL